MKVKQHQSGLFPQNVSCQEPFPSVPYLIQSPKGKKLGSAGSMSDLKGSPMCGPGVPQVRGCFICLHPGFGKEEATASVLSARGDQWDPRTSRPPRTWPRKTRSPPSSHGCPLKAKSWRRTIQMEHVGEPLTAGHSGSCCRG